MHPFEEYLKRQQLDALAVSRMSHVRYWTVWKATRGHPIQPEQAKKIRQAVVCQTGVAYTGPFALAEPEAVEELPTLPIKKLSRCWPS